MPDEEQVVAPEDVEEITQNLAEGVPPPAHPDFHPDLPDPDSPEWQAEIALDEEEQS